MDADLKTLELAQDAPRRSMQRLVLLDLFCCEGGAGEGYRRAGFDVVGVDIEDKSGRNPHPFVQGDALEYLAAHGHEYDIIHASPPCQSYSKNLKHMATPKPMLIEPLMEILKRIGKPWIVENVDGAPLATRSENGRHGVMLCGTMFGKRVYRHRLFETTFPIAAPPCGDMTGSGARWWEAKDRDGRTAASAELFYQTIRTVEFMKPDWWALENPPGRLPRVVPELADVPRMIFDPCDFARYVKPREGDLAMTIGLRAKAARKGWNEITPDEVELTKRLNLYTKRTVLYGHFPPLKKDRREPINVCAAGSWLMRLGGKSEATKNARSATPEGFALAFFDAVCDYALDWDAIEEGDAVYHSFQDQS